MLRLILLICLGTLIGCADSSGAINSQAKPTRPVVRTGTPAKAWGPLVIDPGDVRLGAIDPNTVHEVELTLRNMGPTPLRIVKTSTDCKCTVPEDLDGTVIAPGASHPMHVTFTARAAPGIKTAKLLLNIDYGEGIKQAHTSIEGDVTMAVSSQPAYVDALKGVRSGTVRVDSLDGRPFRIMSINGESPVHADGFKPGAAPRTTYTLRWDIDYPTQREECLGDEVLWWVVETDHPDCPVLPLRIRHECTGVLADPTYKQRGWLFTDYMVNLGGLKAGEPIEIDVGIRRLDDKPTIGLIAVESLSPDATAELVSVLEPADEDSTCRVRFTPRAGYDGLMYAMVNFRSATGYTDLAFLARVSP